MYVGLELNRDVAYARRSLPGVMAIGGSFSGKFSDGWFAAISDDDKTAIKLASKVKIAAKERERKQSGNFR